MPIQSQGFVKRRCCSCSRNVDHTCARRLVALGVTSTEYAEAKEPWFDSIHERAEAWALETGWEPHGG